MVAPSFFLLVALTSSGQANGSRASARDEPPLAAVARGTVETSDTPARLAPGGLPREVAPPSHARRPATASRQDTVQGNEPESSISTVAGLHAQATQPFGALEFPLPGSVARSPVTISGWASGQPPVDNVELSLDGVLVAQVPTDIARPDLSIPRQNQTHPTALRAGFEYHLGVAALAPGAHVITAVAVDSTGARQSLGSRTVMVVTPQSWPAPFGDIDGVVSPERSLTGDCKAGLLLTSTPISTSPLPLLSGWVLRDTSLAAPTRVSHVVFEIDGIVVADTRTDCRLEPLLGFLAFNCLGQYRSDIDASWGGLPNARRSGFVFSTNVPDLVNRVGLAPGLHVAQVKATDSEGATIVVREERLRLRCLSAQDDFPAVGEITQPIAQEVARGRLVASGWALDPDGVTAVRLLVDGQPVENVSSGSANADLGLPSPGVGVLAPGVAGSTNSGWRFVLDTTVLSNAPHVLSLEAEDRLGRKTVCRSVTLNVANY